MRKYYAGFDFLRGLGIIVLVVLHTAFYFYDGLYDIDINNPSLIVTIIGFLLMFAGLFAMISGAVHTVQHTRKKQIMATGKHIKYMLISGLLILGVAYLYFLFTGPGLVDFDARAMDESLFVALINHGTLALPSQARLLYVDSLVMLGLNVILLAGLFACLERVTPSKVKHHTFLIMATLWMVLSLLRLPLYTVYLDAVDQGRYGVVILLNFFVNKNNPIFPFFGFALFGAWIGRLLEMNRYPVLKKWLLPVSFGYIIIGIIGYVLAPETMLEREIDLTWYFIMVTQIGLFLLLILGALRYFDFSDSQHVTRMSRFLMRFGVAGLTVFFIESVFSALLYRGFNLIFPIELSMSGAILYGFLMAFIYGFLLLFWERKHYVFGIEHAMTTLLKRFGKSTKAEKLKGKTYGID